MHYPARLLSEIRVIVLRHLENDHFHEQMLVRKRKTVLVEEVEAHLDLVYLE